MDTLQRLQTGNTVTGASPQVLAVAVASPISSDVKLHIDTSLDEEDATAQFNLLDVKDDTKSKDDEFRAVSTASSASASKRGSTKDDKIKGKRVGSFVTPSKGSSRKR